MRLKCLIIAAAMMCLAQLDADGQEKKKEEVKTPPNVVAPKVAPVPLTCCPPGHSFKHLDGKPLVFVANGVGGSTKLSDNLIDVNSDYGLGLRIRLVAWARHNARYQDLLDHQAQLHAAANIACTVTAIRKDCPNLPIFLVGHSAGARVVLAAGEMLPENSVDRIVVMAPAVTCMYNLTGAMRASRGGVVNFYSSEDNLLEAAEQHTALADGLKGPAAGRVGFRPPCSDSKEVAAYFRRLHQVRWTENWAGSGGHGTWTISHNLKKIAGPIFTCAAPIEPPPLIFEKKMPPAK